MNAIYIVDMVRDMKNWIYETNYEKENRLETDVLIIGGGIAGIHAAIAAKRKGAEVSIVDKGPISRSGSGGAGVDHWWLPMTQPNSPISPEEMREYIEDAFGKNGGELGNPMTAYITCMESYEALLDIEKAGVQIRDINDEFVGSDFRNDETKFLYAYDYKNKYCIRIKGADIKPKITKMARKLGVNMLERIMITSLLTSANKVIGAMGIHTRTGEFYIISAKSVIITTNNPNGLWNFNEETRGSSSSFNCPNNTCEGYLMALNAGAEFVGLDRAMPFMTPGANGYPMYGTGNAHNTWFGCELVDSTGKKIPWVDGENKEIHDIKDRFYPAQKQTIFFPYGTFNPKYFGPQPTRTLSEKIKKGEYKLPLFADLPSMPEDERKMIWGFMVGNEGKTQVPIFENYTKAGFNPNTDILQANIVDKYNYMPWWSGDKDVNIKDLLGGIKADWNLQTTVEGLFVSGGALAGGANHAGSASTGRYAGRNAAFYASNTVRISYDESAISNHKYFVYQFLMNKPEYGYKDILSASTRIMREYYGGFFDEYTINAGIKYLDGIINIDCTKMSANNPRELIRVIEAYNRVVLSKKILEIATMKLQRDANYTPNKATKRRNKIKYNVIKKMYKKYEMELPITENDLNVDDSIISYKLVHNRLHAIKLEDDWWLKGNYSDDYKVNYKYCCKKYEEDLNYEA